MEETKLQALADSLSKHGGRKGLGTYGGQYSWSKSASSGADDSEENRTDGLPNNALYSKFVKEGTYDPTSKTQLKHGDGRAIKRDFSDIPVLVEDGSSEETKKSKKLSKEERKASKKVAKIEAKRHAKLEEKRKLKLLAKKEKEAKESNEDDDSAEKAAKKKSKRKRDKDGKDERELKTSKKKTKRNFEEMEKTEEASKKSNKKAKKAKKKKSKA